MGQCIARVMTLVWQCHDLGLTLKVLDSVQSYSQGDDLEKCYGQVIFEEKVLVFKWKNTQGHVKDRNWIESKCHHEQD